jgi:hypothetical protein
MSVSSWARLRELQEENTRVKRRCAELAPMTTQR